MEMPDQPLLTFVVPCYNVEKYIQHCLDSIFHCELDENCFEVLCVDDCSTDGTSFILRYNAELHRNLQVITHEVNRGWGAPRNTGIKEAKGRYLWFVDADDMIRENGLAKAVERVVDEELDVLCFNYDRVNDVGEVLSSQKVFDEVSSRDGYSFVKEAFNGSIVFHMGYVWRFIYKIDYLRSHQLYFPEHVCWEDTVFMPKSILEAERVSSIPDVLYSYRVNTESVSGVFSRVYPANLIYDYAFCAGGDLLQFSEEVEDEELKMAFRNAAINKYINGFAIHLFRTNIKARREFYKMVTAHKHDLELLSKQMTPLNRLLLAFPLAADFGSMVYKLTHKNNM